jgi:hypothetical protein
MAYLFSDKGCNALATVWRRSFDDPGGVGLSEVCRLQNAGGIWLVRILSGAPMSVSHWVIRPGRLSEGDISLTDEGKRFVLAGFDECKGLFAQHVLTYIPLAAYIKHVPDERPSHRAHAKPLSRRARGPHVRGGRRTDAARGHLVRRYGEAFAYDDSSDALSLENPK